MSLEYFEVSDGTDVSYGTEGYVTVKRTFLVTRCGSETAAIAAIPIVRYDAHPTYTTALAKQCDAKRKEEGDTGNYEVVYVYDSKPIAQGDRDATDPADSDKTKTPPDRPYTVSISAKTVESHLNGKDRGAPQLDLLNPVGQPLINFPAVTDSHMVLSISGWCDKDFDYVSHVATYFNTVNDGIWDGWDARAWKVNSMKFETTYEEGEYWYKFAIELEMNPTGWNPLKVAAMGTLYKYSNSLPPQPILDRQGNPVKDPVRLNKTTGVPLIASDTTQYQEFTIYYETDFDHLLDFTP